MADVMFQIPDDASDSVKREYSRFMKAYTERLNKLRNLSLTILIWGQSPSRDTPVSRKRMQIKESLSRENHNALFSEDIDPGMGHGLSEKTKELIQAEEAHLIIVLVEDSPGASAELHDFGVYDTIRQKLLVMVPRGYSGGYSGKGLVANLDDAHGNIFWYDETQLLDCSVCKKALQKAQAMRELMFHEKKKRR
jgi:hypothetical protein